MKRPGFFLLLFTLSIVLSAQESFKISKPEPTLSNNILTIKYDITGCPTGELVDIRLIILNSKGDTLKPIYISGDIGLNINCGFGKTIVWDLSRDNLKLDEDVDIQIEALKSAQNVQANVVPEQKKLTRANVILSSVFVSGLGQKKATKKSGYFVLSGIVYGGIGTACYFNFIKSKQLKEDYMAASDPERENLFNKWEKSYDMARYCLYGAIGVWAVNIIWASVIHINENPLENIDFGLKSTGRKDLMICLKWRF